MGLYIEQYNGISKEQFLKTYGKEIEFDSIFEQAYVNGNIYDDATGFPITDNCPVCVFDNGMFKAAGIAYNLSQFIRFVNGANGRTCTWYMVPCNLIEQMYPSIFDSEAY